MSKDGTNNGAPDKSAAPAQLHEPSQMDRAASAMPASSGAQKANATNVLPEPGPIPHTHSAPPAPMPDKPKILVAEDISSVLKMHEKILQKHFTVVTAKDGQQAFDLYAAALKTNAPFVAVLSDENMPRMNGSALLAEQERLSAETGIPRAPHITISGDEPTGYKAEDARTHSQSDAFFIKPAKYPAIVTAVKEQIALHAEKMTEYHQATAAASSPHPASSPRPLTIPEEHGSESQPSSPKIISPKPQHAVQESTLLSNEPPLLPSPQPELGGRNSISPTLAQMARDLAPNLPPSPKMTPPLPATPRAASAPAETHAERLSSPKPPSPGQGRS